MIGDIDVVQRFRGLRVLVIGDAMLDSYLEGTAARICSEAPVPVVRKLAEERVPGGAANVAANLAALGAEVFLLGATGDDPAGQLLRAALRDRDIDDSWLVTDARATTLHKLRILANGQYIVRFDEGGDGQYGRTTRQSLQAALDHIYPSCDLVVLSDYNYGVISDALLGEIRRLREGMPLLLAVDTKKLVRFREVGATIITPNHLEARVAAGLSTDDADVHDIHATMRVGRRLIEAIDTEHLAITLGAEGVCLINRCGQARHLPGHPVPHVSDVGAGDSFLAVIALAIASGAQAHQSARIAIEASCVAAGKRRTSTVSLQELLQRISLQAHIAEPRGVDRELGSLVAALDTARAAGQTVVFTNGIFDLLHAGHVEFLRRARQLGDLLVVGVNSNRTTRLLKGVNRPLNDERNRLALVRALEPVSHALLFDDEEPSAIIRALQPDIHVKGGDYAGIELPEADAVAEVGGRIVILPLAGASDARQLIERISVLEGDEIGAEL